MNRHEIEDTDVQSIVQAKSCNVLSELSPVLIDKFSITVRLPKVVPTCQVAHFEKFLKDKENGELLDVIPKFSDMSDRQFFYRKMVRGTRNWLSFKFDGNGIVYLKSLWEPENLRRKGSDGNINTFANPDLYYKEDGLRLQLMWLQDRVLYAKKVLSEAFPHFAQSELKVVVSYVELNRNRVLRENESEFMHAKERCKTLRRVFPEVNYGGLAHSDLSRGVHARVHSQLRVSAYLKDLKVFREELKFAKSCRKELEVLKDWTSLDEMERNVVGIFERMHSHCFQGGQAVDAGLSDYQVYGRLSKVSPKHFENIMTLLLIGDGKIVSRSADSRLYQAIRKLHKQGVLVRDDFKKTHYRLHPDYRRILESPGEMSDFQSDGAADSIKGRPKIPQTPFKPETKG
ncbi:hypothetical protein [Bdellovibrio bacteriovorus]|uniref:hypothetical protein n=1 Tax=Bdellovibrio bacteriovorus TaxID=959 RepID=UPI0035A67AE8